MERLYVLFFIVITVYITHHIILKINEEKYSINSNLSVQTYVLNTSKILYKTNRLFLSFSIDSNEIKHGLRNHSLRNSKLIRLTSYLSPAYLRIGGTEADRLVFEEENSVLDYKLVLNPNDTFKMSARNWAEIYKFAENSGFRLLFDLNVLLRNHDNWDPSNAKSLIAFSASKGYKVDWQLGNEPNAFRHIFNLTVSPIQLSKDFIALRHLLDLFPEYHKALVVGPDVNSPHHQLEDVSIPAEWFLHEFVNSEGISQAVDIVTWHHYYLHQNATLPDFLSPAVFNSLEKDIFLIQKSVESSGKPIWITESGSASGGGVAGVTDRFVSIFMLLDRLGLSARQGMGLVVRQSLYSGHYALIDQTTLRPNPEWWVSYMYKRLIASMVLSVEPRGDVCDTLRIYAHCSHSGSVIVFGLNLNMTPVQLIVETAGGSSTIAHLYQLTSPHLLSRKVMLNGVPLKLPKNSPPDLPYIIVDTLQPVNLAGHSIFFLDFKSFQPHICKRESVS